MSKIMKIKEYIKNRLVEIDRDYENESDVMNKLKLSTMRTSFANILHVYLNEQEELGISYYKHALTYLNTGCYQQALFYAELAKKNLKDLALIEQTFIINLNCLLKLNKIDEASDLLKEAKPMLLKQQYYEIKAQIMEKIGDEEAAFQSMEKLGEIIVEKFTDKSAEMGLYLIEKGKKKGFFCKYSQSLKLMQDGMDILIEVRYKDHSQIGKIYLLMASYKRQLNDLQAEYTSLICAYSMIRQEPNQQKALIDTLHKIATNLFEREQFQAGLKELYKIEGMEKHIYGESSLTVAKTIKKISEILIRVNRKIQSKKYEQQYNRIVSCNDRKGMSRQKPLKYSQVKLHN